MKTGEGRPCVLLDKKLAFRLARSNTFGEQVKFAALWGIVQRQDCGLWLRQWRFESSSPSHFFNSVIS
jgi:hypothetical protein